MTHYLWWIAPMLGVLGLLVKARSDKISLAIARLVAMYAPTDHKSKRAFEVLRLNHEHAELIESYLPEPEPVMPAATTAPSDQKRPDRKRPAKVPSSRTLPSHPQITR